MSSWRTMKSKIVDVLVVGGGAAGCYAAIRAKEKGMDTAIVDKGYVGVGSGSAVFAGATNICLPEDDADSWMQEIVQRGEYLNDQEWVKIQLEQAYPLALQIDQWGEQYGFRVIEKDEQGRIIRRKARGNINTLTSVVNAFPMMETLRRKAIELGVHLYERIMMTDLVRDKEGNLRGALGFNYRTGEFYLFLAKAVILAAGGCGFKNSIGSPVAACTGEAQCMAFQAGAVLRNLDQAYSNSNPKLIELHGMSLFSSVGGKFLNSQGEEFMRKYDPAVGSRARLTKLVIAMAKEADAGRAPIYMDLTGTSPADQEMLKRVLPEAFEAFNSSHIDPFRERIEWMPIFGGTRNHGGGIHIDTRCASSVAGLFAAGDTTCTPEHGTWSITGLNIPFAWISGHRAGEFASEYVKDVQAIMGNKNDVKDDVEVKVRELCRPLKNPKGITPDEATFRIMEILVPYKVCYLRNEARLKEALEKMEAIRKDVVPDIRAADLHSLMKAAEVRSMALIGEFILRSVLFRRESRGFVYREDFPMTNNRDWLKWIMVQKGAEGDRVWAEDFATPFIQPPREIYPPA